MIANGTQATDSNDCSADRISRKPFVVKELFLNQTSNAMPMVTIMATHKTPLLKFVQSRLSAVPPTEA